MVRVERGNVVLKVKEDEVQHYLKLGYSVTNNVGSVLKAAIPTDFGTLQKLYLDQKVKITELEKTVAKLTAENTELSNTLNAKKRSKKSST